MTYPERFESLAPLDAHKAALTVRIVGWMLLVHDALFVAFVEPARARDNSRLWPLWTVAEGLAGLTLVVAGSLMEERAAEIDRTAGSEKTKRKGAA